MLWQKSNLSVHLIARYHRMFYTTAIFLGLFKTLSQGQMFFCLFRWILQAHSLKPNKADTFPANPRTRTLRLRTRGRTWQAARTPRGADPPTESAAPGRTSSRPPWPAQGSISSRLSLRRQSTRAAGLGCHRTNGDKPRCPSRGATTLSRTGLFPWWNVRGDTAPMGGPRNSAAKAFPETETSGTRGA